MAIVVLLEVGSLAINSKPAAADLQSAVSSVCSDHGDACTPEVLGQLAGLGGNKPPGLGIPYLALIDGVLLFTIGLMGIGLIVRENLQGKLQGIATLIFSILLVL